MTGIREKIFPTQWNPLFHSYKIKYYYSVNSFKNRYDRHFNNLEKTMAIKPVLSNEPGQWLIF